MSGSGAPVEPNVIASQLKERTAPSLKDALSTRGLTIDDFAQLMAPILTTKEFRVELITPGLTAMAALLIPDDELPIFLKLAPDRQIQQEVDRFNQTIKRKMPHRLRPSEVQRSPVTKNGYSVLQYPWVGDEKEAETLNSAVCSGKLTKTSVNPFIDDLVQPMWEFHHASATSRGIPHFYWAKKRDAILSHLAKFADKPAVKELEEIVLGQNRWDDIRLKRRTRGRIHGDLHCGNVLVVAGRKDLQPRLVDFFCVEENGCPARDWAKLERELKFLTLRQVTQADFSNVLAAVNRGLMAGETPVSSNVQEQVCFLLMKRVRSTYFEQARHAGSRIYRTEYLYHLLCWELEYLFWNHFPAGSPNAEAFIDSAICTLNGLKASIKEETSDKEKMVARRQTVQGPTPILLSTFRATPSWQRALLKWTLRRHKNEDATVAEVELRHRLFMPPLLFFLYSTNAIQFWYLQNMQPSAHRFYVSWSVTFAVIHLITLFIRLTGRKFMYKAFAYGVAIYTLVLYAYGLRAFRGGLINSNFFWWSTIGGTAVWSLVFVILLWRAYIISAPRWHQREMEENAQRAKRWALLSDPLGIYDDEVKVAELGRRAKLISSKYVGETDYQAGCSLARDYPETEYAWVLEEERRLRRKRSRP